MVLPGDAADVMLAPENGTAEVGNGGNANEHGDVDMNELFGSSDSDADDHGDVDRVDRVDNRDRQDDQDHQNDQHMDEGADPSSAIPERPPPMEIPTSLHDALPPSRNHLAKLPPSVRIVPEEFREEAFAGETSEDRDGLDIRWRYGLDDRSGKLIRESNARVVTWSDGSQTLHIGGNMAVYKMKAIDISKDETYLYASHARLIQCQGKLHDKLMFNPISVKQAASRPKSQSSKSSRSVKVKQTATLVDPVKEREVKERNEEARIREKEKLIEKQKQMQRNAILNDPKFARRSYYGTRGLSAAFLEEDEEGGGPRAVNEEEYDEDDGWLVDDDEDQGGRDADDGEDDVEDADDADDADDGDDGDDEIDVVDANEEGDGGQDGANDGAGTDPSRQMVSADAEVRNEAALMSIMAEGKANDQGDGGAGKKKRKVISSDSDDD